MAPRAGVILAFAAIYLLWGSTYLAIRVAVHDVPPLFAAGLRFTLAGIVVYGYSRMRGAPKPSPREWRSIWILAVALFLVGYGGLFWAEKTVPSGIASVLVALLPIWMSLLEVLVFRTQRLTPALAVSVVLGFGGVILLAAPGGGPRNVSVLACLAILAGGISWASGSLATRTMPLPSSKVLSAGAQMMTGGMLLLTASALAGEMHPFPRITPGAAWSIAYLAVAGSIVAFTAYIWLIGFVPATKVSSYAYVNPVVAVALGHWLGGEVFPVRALLGAALVLASVVLILTLKPAAH